MYSYEARLRAVRLYIKLGKRISVTIRQLGYPTKNALKSWYREYEQNRDVRAGYARLPKYSQDDKERAVRHYLECGNCLAVTIKALETVAANSERPVVHSDRGGHYRWPGWLSRVSEAKLVRSMSRKGCSPDNAACEGFFGRLKNELFYSRDWMSVSIEEFVSTLNAYIQWYNDTRIKDSLAFRSPIEHRRDLGIAA